MNLSITEGAFGVRPSVTKPNPEFLKQLGEERFRKLINDHYELLKRSDIAHLFPSDEAEFELAKKHAADFMIQISGGPMYFNESRGAPKMVNRHAPFKINMHARERWLQMYQQILPALVDEGIDESAVQSYWDYIDIFSIWMVNTQS